MRIIVEEAVTRKILSRDLEVMKPTFISNLSAPCQIEFTIPYMSPSSRDIDFKSQGQIIHVEDIVNGQRVILGSGIVQPTETDEKGDLKITAEGFSGYAKGIPWLDNYNPVVVDPFAVIQRIWSHIQSYNYGNLNVEVYPASSGTFLLPGFGFDGTNFNIEFFAFYVRAADFRDCGEEMEKLARDIPFDYMEQSAWNSGRTQIDKKIQLAYTHRGGRRVNLSFRMGENVISGKEKPESEIEWTSDVIVRGWFPGRIYSSTFTNADPKRFRRVIKQEDAKINSRERSAVWAKRKLTRRQVPDYWESIVIDKYHPSAPWGSWEVGDEIFVQGFMPHIGKVEAWHKIMSYKVSDDDSKCELQLKHEGAFNYDPLEFEG